MKKLLVFLISSICSIVSIAQQYNHKVNLSNCENDKLKVQLACPAITEDIINFNFPITIPGTYSIINYVNYISDFKAFDVNNKQLQIQKAGINSYTIFSAKNLKTLTYTVDDTWDSKEKKHVFEPTGTGFEKGEYFYINNGGLFGYFDNMLRLPVVLEFSKSSNLKGFSSLTLVSKNNESQVFQAENYDALIDNPILFTPQKEEKIKISNTDITIASYYQANDSSAYFIKSKIEPCMQATEVFLGGSLPVSNYNFLNYAIDAREDWNKASHAKNKFQLIRLMYKYMKIGFGALEHNTSSSYYLADMSENSYADMIKNTSIHEFMHIITPLSLHSNLVGDFNYTNPKMSKHLWLYEGITEYFTVLIEMQGNLTSVKSTIKSRLKDKIKYSYSYPDSIPFTRMSENVYQEKYKKLYIQVYQRGAIMAMLLDFEIMRLTNGKKTLKNVVFELVKMYGKDKSFSEDEIIPLFVKLVHPDLQKFFDSYITGIKPLDIENGFKTVGISYHKEEKGRVPINLLSKKDNGVKLFVGLPVDYYTIIKVDKKNIAGFMNGDKVSALDIQDCFFKPNGDYVKEGENINLKVIRDGKEVILTFPAKFKDGVAKNVINLNNPKTAEQEKLFRLWTTGKIE